MEFKINSVEDLRTLVDKYVSTKDDERKEESYESAREQASYRLDQFVDWVELGQPMPEPKKPLIYCSFCAKSNEEVEHMVAGPAVFICDSCIKVCQEVVDEEDAKAAKVLERAGGKV